MLRSLASLGVFAQPEPGSFALTPLGETLVSDGAGSMQDLALTWMETHYGAFGRLLDGVMSGQPAASLHYGQPFFNWLASDAQQVQRFTGAMANLTDGIKRTLSTATAFPPVRSWPTSVALTAAC